MSEGRKLRLQLFRKRIRDSKLKTKIRISLFLITILTILGIGSYSYHVARRELIRNAEQSVVNLQKQGSRNLDDRVDDFEDATFQILQASGIEKVLGYTSEEAEAKRVVNEGLPTVITQHSILQKYTDFALLRPLSGRVYSYYRSGHGKLSSVEEQQLLDKLDSMVELHHIKHWINLDGVIFFVRQVVLTDLRERGILCFAVKEEFFDFLGDELQYLNEDRMLIYNRQGEILWGGIALKQVELTEELKNRDEIRSGTENFSVQLGTDVMAVTVSMTPSNGWKLVSFYLYSELLEGIRRIIRGILWAVLAAAVVIIGITFLISRQIEKNVTIIENGMRHYEEGDFGYRIRPASYDEVGLLGLQLNYMALRLHDLIEKLQLKEEEKKQLEIETLQAQINPHFLYNTLGSLKWAAFRNGQKDLAGSLDALIALLRFTIKKADSMVSVEEEADYIRNYVAVEKMRYGDSFTVEYQIAENTREMQIPGFILQPLVENSIIHGLDQTKPGGKITIRAEKTTDVLCIEVEDNGLGIPEEKRNSLLQPQEKKKSGGLNSIGMKIVDRRLKEMYGDKYRTEILSEEGHGTTVQLWIPLTADSHSVQT